MFTRLTCHVLAGACSALFLQTLALEAKNVSDDGVVTLEHVRQVAATHDNVDETALDHLSEQSAPRRPRKKKTKLDASLKDSAVQEAVAASAAASYRPEITVDEEDYD